MRSLIKQVWSDAFPYDSGVALIDEEGVQWGWYKDRKRAEDDLRNENASEVPATHHYSTENATESAISG